MNAVFLNIEETRMVPALREVGEKLDGTEGKVVLDFCSVPGSIRTRCQRSKSLHASRTRNRGRSPCAASTWMFTKCSNWLSCRGDCLS
jgi:hypothetical protein